MEIGASTAVLGEMHDTRSQVNAAELQEEIKELIAVHNKEKESLLETISKKNLLLDMQRIKLYRYEFALKEAVLFLGKPLLAYDDWLNNRQGAGSLASVSAALGSLSNPSLNQSSYTHDSHDDSAGLTPQRSRHMSISPSGPLGVLSAPSGLPLKNQSLACNPEKLHDTLATSLRIGVPAASPMLPLNVTLLESQCLECMRLALNFLQSAQKSINAINAGTYVSTANTFVASSENESLALLGSNSFNKCDSPSIRRHDSSSHSRAPRVEVGRSDSFRASGLSSVNAFSQDLKTASSSNTQASRSSVMPGIPGSSRAMKNTAYLPVGRKTGERDDEQDEGDLSTTSTMISPSGGGKAKCATCREHLIQIDHLKDTIKELQLETQHLEIEYNNEKSAKQRIIHSKENIDQEIEELTSQLFDQANHLVSEQARLRDETETSYKNLRIKFQMISKKLQSRDEELKLLKRQMYDVQGTQMFTNSFLCDERDGHNHVSMGSNKALTPAIHTVSAHDEATMSIGAAQFSRQQPGSIHPSMDMERPFIHYSHTIVAGYDMFESSIAVDGVLFLEFQEHVKTIILAGSQSPIQAYTTTYSTTFMKRCIAESVEPCLLYSYQLPSTGFSKSVAYGGGMPASFKKKLMDCAMKGLCEVKLVVGVSSPRMGTTVTSSPNEKFTLGSSISGSLPQPVPKDRCALCTIVRDCEYAIQLLPVPSGSKQWMGLCRFCRDRVTSVLDFFTYSNYMLQGSIGPGKQGATILSIFRQMQWLCRRMSVAKIGSCSMFETPLSAITGPGGGGDWETDIKILA
ncbi:hypothetical protein BASA81_018241 [Batrachochytrium salamandrivorans]|nr:hypothetical protein BASA62_008710 [Batrachochytrium salamandrivorans]KAH9244364.1 hypothetical protein BASA81_018241 [Batrachochytrium salamandrivorans]